MGRAEIEAALVLLRHLGVSPSDLAAGDAGAGTAVPTFAEFVPQVAATVSAGTLKAYGSYWNRVVDAWGSRAIDEPTPLEIQQFGERIRSSRTVRRNGRDGRGAVENYIAALRCLYRRAVANGLIREADNPAIKVAKPRRLPSTRRALPDARLAEISTVAATTGDDPELDSLLLRIHLETACRRGGALKLRPMDLDEQQCLIRLREKGGTERWQPVSPTLMAHLQEHVLRRGAPHDGQLLRYRNGRPITYRRYDGLWVRIGRHLPWVATQGISAHWLRHTVLTWVERNFGYAVARAFAGHTDARGEAGSTTTYVRADVQEVAGALAALTNEAHPAASI
ncbi:integrase [Hamadaea flava]|uniref:Tyrosine-type recombinase/integrase n=1 Tax=Hamadaea flava TaxID=1742688 RepID=A0ABV8LEZ4_9ACTN|nr:site-specific integrase [Hamadaea flava]MCP2323422.1 integrase [Hamadaea flava]